MAGNYGMVAGHRGNGADGAVDPASPDPDGVFVPASQRFENASR